MKRGAVLSECGTYRYHLWRIWDDRVPPMGFVMLNPSTADAEVDDPTIRRCIGFARREGCGSVSVTNLFGFRATDPAALTDRCNPITGPEDSLWIERYLDVADGYKSQLVVGWGGHKVAEARARFVAARAATRGVTLWCLGTTKSGAPRHPLYVKGDQPLIPWVAP